MARRWVVRIFLGFAAFCSLWRPVSRHIAVLPQCRIGAFCPPPFRLASLRRHTPRQASWGKRKYSGAAGNLRSVRPLLFCFQRSAVFSFLHTLPPPTRVFFSLPPIHPAASRFLRSNFRKLQRGADASVDFLQTSRFPSAARPPHRPPGTSSSEPPEHPTSRFLNLLISQPPKSQPVESGSALRASRPRWRCRCESVGRLGASLPP